MPAIRPCDWVCEYVTNFVFCEQRLRWQRTEWLSWRSSSSTSSSRPWYSSTSRDRRRSSKLISSSTKNLINIGTLNYKRRKRRTSVRLKRWSRSTHRHLSRTVSISRRLCQRHSSSRLSCSTCVRFRQTWPSRKTIRKLTRYSSEPTRWRRARDRSTWKTATRKY